MLSGLLDAAGVADTQQNDALVALDKLDKIGAEGVADELAARGIERTVAETCSEGVRRGAGRVVQSRRWGASSGCSAAGNGAIANLRAVVSLADSTAAAGKLRVDPSLARGLSYYTGAIMEIAVPDLAGSLGGGGRYDNLVGMFLGRDVPACGFSLGLERIIVVMTERKMFPAKVSRGAVDVMIAVLHENLRCGRAQAGRGAQGREAARRYLSRTPARSSTSR